MAGSKPTGIIMYDANGLMNVQIMPDRPRPKYTGAPTPEQALDAMRDPRQCRRFARPFDKGTIQIDAIVGRALARTGLKRRHVEHRNE